MTATATATATAPAPPDTERRSSELSSAATRRLLTAMLEAGLVPGVRLRDTRP